MRRLVGVVGAVWMAVMGMLLGGCRAPTWVGADMYAPQVSREAAMRMADVLGMDGEQRAAAAELHAEYALDYLEAARKMRAFNRALDELRRIRPGDSELITKGVDAHMRYARHCEGLQSRLLEDMKLLLREEQMRNWERAERLLRRFQLLRGYGDAAADLVEVVRDEDPWMDLDARGEEELRRMLEDYEQAMDARLVQKLAFIRDTMAENVRNGLSNRGADQAELYKRWRALVREERKLNSRFARRMSELLPDERRADFRRRVNKATMPHMYGDGPLSEALARLGASDELDDETRAQVQALRAEYEEEVARLADRVCAALEAWEEKATLEELVGGPGNLKESKELEQELKELGERVQRRLAEIVPGGLLAEVGLQGHVTELPPLDFEEE